MSTSATSGNEVPSNNVPEIRNIANIIFQSTIHIVLVTFYFDRQYICDYWFLNLAFQFFFGFRMYTLWYSYKHDFEGEKREKGQRLWELGGHDQAYWRMIFLAGWALICIREVGFLAGSWLAEL
ncbi:hypothetical protein E6O75_ATG04161 [Venturia nashicola]|uniref:Uncharacterized protein n=1 Tax=Venturia nashicola TaxID=86259 RepID=A0A4Z1PHH1_9PEZI|nr:hypothetical protein E6O75_ATG04161 [Venturia nashicola]